LRLRGLRLRERGQADDGGQQSCAVAQRPAYALPSPPHAAASPAWWPCLRSRSANPTNMTPNTIE
jgi:hypothetical protein